MPEFRELMAEADAAIYAALGDSAIVAGKPVRAMFGAPWLNPSLNTMRTDLLEPHLVVRDSDAAGITAGIPASHAGRHYVIVRCEPDSTGLTTLVLREVAA